MTAILKRSESEKKSVRFQVAYEIMLTRSKSDEKIVSFEGAYEIHSPRNVDAFAISTPEPSSPTSPSDDIFFFPEVVTKESKWLANVCLSLGRWAGR